MNRTDFPMKEYKIQRGHLKPHGLLCQLLYIRAYCRYTGLNLVQNMWKCGIFATMIRLEPLNLTNWHHASNLSVEEDQQKFIPNNLYSIAQAKFEPNSEVLGIYKDSRLVGMMIVAMWSGVYWISRIMIDRFEQGNGYGTKAIELAKKYIFDKRNVKEIRTSIARENAAAEYVFHQNGFRRMGEVDDKEFTMRVEYGQERNY